MRQIVAEERGSATKAGGGCRSTREREERGLFIRRERESNCVTVSAVARAPVLLAAFVIGLIIRIQGISRHFWLLGDQIRDWSIALRPVGELPLGGPPTDSAIGPAFYWGLWIIRVTIGPWFDNLPHAAGIGQAMLQSSSDALLLAAVWRRSRSLWIALATIVLVAAASHDLSLSAVVSRSMMGLAFAKIATALVLLEVPGRSAVGAPATAAIAWCAVQCDPAAIFVATAVFAAMAAAPILADNRPALFRNLWSAAIVVAVLQVPHAVDRTSEWHTFTQMPPWVAVWLGWLLVACSAVVAVKKKMLPQTLASMGLVLLVAVLASVPGGPRVAWTRQQMPEYGILLDGSRKIAKLAQPMQAIHADFALPPTSDSEFLYTILGGRIDRASPWFGVILRDGTVAVKRVSPAQ
jgi:hypothetical protein